jgi:hypothetical protein
VRRSNESVSFNIIKEKPWRARRRYSHLRERKRPEVKETGKQIRNEGSIGSYKRGAYRGNQNDKNSLQGNIAEFGNNVYQYGIQEEGEKVHQNGRGDSQLCQKRV